jgi:hypothetical protein
MISFVWQGILATPGAPLTSSSAVSWAHNTLSRTTAHTPGRRNESVRRSTSLTVGRVEPFPITAPPITDTASKSPVRKSAAARGSRWSRPFKAVCGIVNMLIDTTSINDDLFDEVFELLCFAYGQDEAMMDAADTSIGAHELVRTMLGVKSGRRGELALRKVLEGKLYITRTEGRSTPEVERKVTRGAVIIARLCIEDKDFVSHANSLAFSFTGLVPSLAAAQSTHRFPGNGTARVPEWIQWYPVDAEILSLLDNHLDSLEHGSSADNVNDDAWTEGEAACELLNGIYPLIQVMA